MTRRLSITVSVVVGVALSAEVARGDDLNPPDYRDQPNSVFVELVPGDQTGPALVVADSNFPVGGFPPYTGDPDGPSGPIEGGGEPQLIGYQPFTPSGGIYTIFVPNVQDDLPAKQFEIQITYEFGIDPPPAEVRVVDGNHESDEGPFKIDELDQIFTPSQAGDPTLKYEVWRGQLFPNPDWEIFEIEASGDLHQVVIDTISLPEPATLSLLSLGGLAALLRRR
jgi:hypothetical protein